MPAATKHFEFDFRKLENFQFLRKFAFFRRVTGRVKSGIYLYRINEECRGLRVPVTCRLLPRVKVLSQRQNRLRLGGRSLRLTQAEEILEIPNRKSKLYAQKARCYKV